MQEWLGTKKHRTNEKLFPSNEKRIPYNWYNNILGLIHMLVALTKLHSQHLYRDNIESNQKNNNNNEVKKRRRHKFWPRLQCISY